MITLSANVIGAERVFRKFENAPAAVRGQVRRAVNELGVTMQGKVKGEQLSGQKLRVRTGRLRRSINLRVKEEGDAIQGQVGTNVSYARRWEMGGSWTENVRAHVRKVRFATTKDGRLMNQGDVWHSKGNIGPATASQARLLVFAKKKAKMYAAEQKGMVKAHTRQVDVKPRRFLRDVLDEMRPTIRGKLLAAINGGLTHGS